MLNASCHKQSTRKRYASTQTSRAKQLRTAREKKGTCVEAGSPGCSTGAASVSSIVAGGSATASGSRAGDRPARRVDVPDPACASSSSSRKFVQLAKVAGIAGGVCVDSSSSDSDGTDSDSTDSDSDTDSGGPQLRPGQGVSLTDDSCIFVQVSALKKLVRHLFCPNCNTQTLTVDVVDKGNGPVLGLCTVCTECLQVCDETLSSDRMGNRSSRVPFATTRRMVAGTMDSGVGFSGLRRLCWYLDSPCIHKSTYARHQQSVATAVTETVQACTDAAAVCVRQMYSDLNGGVAVDGPLDISVSYDASWLTRGHRSLYGFGAAIDLETNLVIDYEVLSLYCHGCTTIGDNLDQNSPEYVAWKRDHTCQKNFAGTAGAMDAAIAAILWKRSIERHNFRYVTLLSDGDARTHNHLETLNVYGDDHHISKEECVNHVAKRMGSALRKVAGEGRKEGVVTGGRGPGRLTAYAITKLTTYYGNAVRTHPHDLPGMKNAVMATFKHAIATDDSHDHSLCPSGVGSWCFHQRATAKGETPGPHKANVHTPLSAAVAGFVRPIYERLGDESLLRRCLRGKTQNSNESLHASIWRKCPKTDFCGKLRVDASVAMAVSEFNQGAAETVAKTTTALGFQQGKSNEKLALARDNERLTAMQRKSDAREKRHRERRRLQRIREHELLTAAEGGAAYGAGEF